MFRCFLRGWGWMRWWYRDWMAYSERFWDEHLKRLENYLKEGTNND
jgi:hypothetical protein